MTDRYKKLKLVQEMTPAEMKSAKETQFDFDEDALGAFVPLDNTWYTEIPQNCKLDTFPVSFRSENYRADAVCDGYIDEKREVYISETELDAGICIEWPI